VTFIALYPRQAGAKYPAGAMVIMMNIMFICKARIE
jgi:hypothetical protein